VAATAGETAAQDVHLHGQAVAAQPAVHRRISTVDIRMTDHRGSQPLVADKICRIFEQAA
jgi:hypothetical protein